ncbi:DNA phosphorothioation-dependent restriction protein DptH [Reinekea marina]|nr:DNA phosphorothioation-dependent restriction protein DptH [Reinekea marina]MDN3647575.1 DNA phosphorothioation-dependent restriction protein DptH [Reinekea marina]
MQGEIVPGYKYQFKSPNHQNSVKLYKAFLNHSSASKLTLGKVEDIHYIVVSGIKLVVVLHKNGEEIGFTENYISFLRDEISSQKGEWANTALIIIHNSLLDTLINSSKDLSAEGGPFHPLKVKESLETFISENDSQDGQRVSKLLLEHQFDLITEDGGSMFGFDSLHRAISDGNLRFSELGMLNDPAIIHMSNDDQIRKRLERNKQLYDKIEKTIEYYPDQLKENLTEFSDSFIEKHMPSEDRGKWKQQCTFDAIDNEIKSNREQLLEVTNVGSASGNFYERFKGSTSAGKKERFIIIEVEPERSDFDISIGLKGAKVERKEVYYSSKSDRIKKLIPNVSGGSQNTEIVLVGSISDEPLFFRIELKRQKSSEKFKFRCLVVKAGWFNISQIQNHFVVNDSKQNVTLQTQEAELCISHDVNTKNRREIDKVNQVYDVNTEGWLDFESIANDVEQITFSIQNGNAKLKLEVEGASASDNLVLPLLFDQSRKEKLLNEGFNGTLNELKRRVYVENSELKAEKSQIDKLVIEAELIEGEVLYRNPIETFSVDDILADNPEVGSAYRALFAYLAVNNTLPSLCGWGQDYIDIVSDVVSAFDQALAESPINQYLDAASINLMKIGFYEDETIWLTPFHPIVLAYTLQLVERAKQDSSLSFFDLPKVTLNRLNAQGLLPYLYDEQHEFAYVQAEQENSGWLRCVPNEASEYSYIPKLVREKVREFSEAFNPLFEESNPNTRPTLIINSVNNHDNHGVFLGLVDHFSKSRDKSFNVHVNLYDDEFEQTEFDLFSNMGNYEKIKARYGLNKAEVKDHSDVIVDILRTRLTYSKFRNADVDSQAYSHLCFYRNNEKVEVVDVDPEEELSGISAGGLINGEASAVEQMNYITGFGTRNVEVEQSPALALALKYSRLVKPAKKETIQHRNSSAIALAVNSGFKAKLERCYDSSIWTTIIDPKVTLDFFDSDSDTLLIHYSDQYTSSSGYDAITVTRQTKMFTKVIERDGGGLVSEFNAFNGEWLLKLLTDNDKLKKEHKGILSAYKLVSILLSKSDITWVPISIAEMVRVSGNIGLKMTESEFARHIHGYRSGAISDDVLFIGFKDQKLYLLPLEVKTGKSYDSKKAITQAKELKRYLSEVLGAETLAGNLYRSLFVRQALLQVDKYELYNVFDDDYFNSLSTTKEWWLQGNYEIAELSEYADGFVVANLEPEKCFSTSVTVEDKILKLEVPSSFIETTISRPLKVLWQDYSGTPAAAISDNYFLENGSEFQDKKPKLDQQDAENLQQDNKDDIEEGAQVGIDKEIEHTASIEAGPLKVLVGHDVNHKEPVYWEPTNTAKFMNTNSGTIGTMGTGKTQSTKSVVTQLYQNKSKNVDGKPIGILIFDYKSDYVDEKFLSATNGKHYQLHKLPYNPLSLFGDTPMLPVHTARGFAETMGKAFGLGQKQQLRLRQLISEAYSRAGISKADKSTWSKPAPTVADLWALFLDQEKIEEDSLYAALESLAELEVFEDQNAKCTSLYELVNGITVIELAGYSPEIQNLVVALTLDLFYSQMQKQGKPQVQGDFRQVTKLILVDEADNFMSQDFPSLRKVLKEGREYGVGVILSTQDITHFKTKENDYSAYILSWVVHRVSQIKNQDIKSLFNIDDKIEQERLMNEIRGLKKHYSLYVNGEKKLIKIKDKAFWELVSEK